jgi:hypothetical protein
MTTSPRKYRAPFRPVDTLSATQKPRFTPQEASTHDDNSYLAADGTSGLLGDSSSLFEGDSFYPSPQYVLVTYPAYSGRAGLKEV